eukprot:m.125632 g.125632  ORF g.125632 m.125632 type:complete len:173 (-) comp17334_c0_seq1:1139-1657(-)
MFDSGYGDNINMSSEGIFDTPIGCALDSIHTSASWSTLDAVLLKVNKHLNLKTTSRHLATILMTADSANLRLHGVWITSFGKDAQPIVCINAAYRRARQEEVAAGLAPPMACKCGNPREHSGATGATAKQYFESHDYNAGRHASTVSKHTTSCGQWTPPTTGHLHSWRRGYT